MSMLGGLGFYLEVSLLLSLAFGLLYLSSSRRAAHPAAAVKLGYLLLFGALVIPGAIHLLPRAELLRPRAQVFSGAIRSSEPHFTLLAVSAAESPDSKASVGYQLREKTLVRVAEWLGGAILLLLLVLCVRIAILHWAIAHLPAIRRIGRVSVHVSDQDAVAYSAWLPGRARVVLPMSLISCPGDFAIALKHELQHQRHGDTRWLYFTEILRAVFFWNPFVHGFCRRLGDLQEYACDEFLVGRRKISPREYGSCLLRAAELAMTPGSLHMRVGTTCMAAASHRSTLKRRIEMILESKDLLKRRTSRGLAVGIAAFSVCLLASAAYAARSAVQDRALTFAEAKVYAKAASEGSSIPISMNEQVLERLNYYIGTEEGRRMVRHGMSRMPQYRAMIRRKTDEYGAPPELIAQAFTESAFQNDAVSPYQAVGIWQFIPQTARKYGLQVSAAMDDRLDPEKETDAAMRYLRDLVGEFGDWRLALLAYNSGESAIEKAIVQTGSRDPWTIEDTQSEPGYLSSVEAMIILLKNPALSRI